MHYRHDVHKDRSGEDLPHNEYVSYTGSIGTEQKFFTDFGLAYDWFKVDDAEDESDKKVTDNMICAAENKFGVGFNALIPKVLVMVDMQGIYADGVYDSLPTTKYSDDEAVKTDDYFIGAAYIAFA